MFVSGLHEETSDQTILDAFGDCGRMKNFHLNLDRATGYVKVGPPDRALS